MPVLVPVSLSTLILRTVPAIASGVMVKRVGIVVGSAHSCGCHPIP